MTPDLIQFVIRIKDRFKKKEVQKGIIKDKSLLKNNIG